MSHVPSFHMKAAVLSMAYHSRNLRKPTPSTRVERDSLGEKEIPSDSYWGINVGRALENFSISGRPISSYPDLILAYACVKQAAARANAEIGVLDRAKADLIDRACEEIKAGKLRDQFIVDIMQGGAGTSTNMNMNEVIANRGLELAERQKGDYEFLDPNDHVNRGQSTNDTYPTALKIALCLSIERLVVEFEELEGAFRDKAHEFSGILKVGRTQLQDAVPMTLEQEFEGYAVTIGEDRASFNYLLKQLWQTNLGATAVGTGITADPRYADAVRNHLAEITGYDIVTAPNLVAATPDVGVFIDVSATLRRSALKLSKICNDLRLLCSGPQAGFAEINLPARQAGSSIMPGKVNPVIPEVVNEVAFIIAGNDVALGMAAEAGQLQLNAFGPVMAHLLLEGLQWLTEAMATLRANCVEGITANKDRLAEQTASFVGVITAFTPYIGYAAASDLAKKALRLHANIADLIVDAGLMQRSDVEVLMKPSRLSGEDTSEPVLSRLYTPAATARAVRE
jgi:aspartate ammonia-lyase